MPKALRVFLPFVLCVLFCAATAQAASVTLAWDRNAEPDVTGYMVAWGIAPGREDGIVNVGNITQYTLGNLPGGLVYFRVYAYNGAGMRSAPSAEISTRLSAPFMFIDAPTHNANVQPDVMVGGWAVDVGAATGAGVNAVQVWAYPNPGSGQAPVFAGSATYGLNRPDVGAMLGSRFAPSGFNLRTIDLAPGPYDLVVYAHSVLEGFNNARVVRVNVQPRGSRPVLAVDVPASNAIVGHPFTIAGWAIDQSATPAQGSGVLAIHVWAFPAGGGAPVFVGVAGQGVPRPDVAAIFGAQFGNAGYTLTGNIPNGDYTMTVYTFSAVAGAFNHAISLPIRVR
jgi:hypothetical protein